MSKPKQAARIHMSSYCSNSASFLCAKTVSGPCCIDSTFRFILWEPDADEIEWYVPAAILVADLKSILVVIEQFIANPISLDGKKASQLLIKQTRRSRRRRKLSPSEDEATLSDNDERRNERNKKKNKEKKQYKSAQFIEDSDAEYGDVEAFLEKEKILRQKALDAATEAGIVDRPVGMRAKGTKKRRRRIGDEGKGRKRRKGETTPQEGQDTPSSLSSTDSDSALGELDAPAVNEEERQPSRPKPRVLAKHRPSAEKTESASSPSSPASEAGELMTQKRTKRLILSDDDDG